MIKPALLKSSFAHALRGLWVACKIEQSFRLHIIFALLVILLAAQLHVSPWDWVVLLLMIGAVMTLELLNSVFERLVDMFRPRLHPEVKDLKDILAGIVLLMAFLSAIIGTIIFWPYLFPLFFPR
jgi:undecaprenol kinase